MFEQQSAEENKKLKYKEIVQRTSKMSGIGLKTVERTLAEYKTKGTISSPNKRKIRETIIQKTDDFDQNAIRQKVHSFWFNREIPTLNNILAAVNEDINLPNFSKTSLHRILKHLNFEYIKKNRNSALIERNDIVCWRQTYLNRIKHFRLSGIPIYYLDET